MLPVSPIPVGSTPVTFVTPEGSNIALGRLPQAQVIAPLAGAEIYNNSKGSSPRAVRTETPAATNPALSNSTTPITIAKQNGFGFGFSSPFFAQLLAQSDSQSVAYQSQLLKSFSEIKYMPSTAGMPTAPSPAELFARAQRKTEENQAAELEVTFASETSPTVNAEPEFSASTSARDAAARQGANAYLASFIRSNAVLNERVPELSLAS